MRLTIFNGSPRGLKSNTSILLDHFSEGFAAQGDHTVESAYLVQIKRSEQHLEMFQKADHVLLAFPLYWDAMPAIVKSFIELLEPLCGRKGNPDMDFIVQSGFNEANHSRYVEKYLEKLCVRLGCAYTGTVVRGGAEGIQVMPDWMTKGLFKKFHDLGQLYAETGQFDEKLVKKLAGHESYPPFTRMMLMVMKRIGLADSYFNQQLKKNNAFDRRFDRPYAE
jgi:NAD(P)H-dependent FMN reductase